MAAVAERRTEPSHCAILCRMRVLVVAVFVIACSSSKKKPEDKGPECPQVVDHMLVVMKGGLTGHDSMALGNRDQMIAQMVDPDRAVDDDHCFSSS